MADTCSVCGKQMDLMCDMPIHHEGCGHNACGGRCSDGRSDYCRKCMSAPVLSSSSSSGNNSPGAAASEPVPARVDRSIQPQRGILAWAGQKVATLANRNMSTAESKDPFFLVGRTVPVRTLIHEKGLGLNQLIAAGITLDHLVGNGYTIADLEQFAEISPVTYSDSVLPEGVIALKALGFRVDHLRDSYTELPYERVCTVTGLNKRHLVEQFGLDFVPGIGIASPGPRAGHFDRNWSISRLRGLGFTTMDDFIDQLHLRFLSHWLQLRPTEAEKKALGVTQAHLDALVNDVPVRNMFTPVPPGQLHIPRTTTNEAFLATAPPIYDQRGGGYHVQVAAGQEQHGILPSNATVQRLGNVYNHHDEVTEASAGVIRLALTDDF